MPPKILLVDDEYSFLEVLALLLGSRGYEISTASDGEEALTQLNKETFDLVVTDYWMPKMDGITLFECMRQDERLRSIPVLLMTAAYDMGLPAAPGLRGILPKPMNYPALLAAVAEVIRLSDEPSD